LTEPRIVTFEKYPVLIVAADTIIGLTVMRALGRRGVPVYGAATLPDALGPRSAYCKGSFFLPDDHDAAVCAIVDHAKRWKVTHLSAISENHIALLNRYRRELEKDFTLLFPPQEVFEKAARKDLTLACAKRVGIPVPETVYPQTMEDLKSYRIQFPVILKPAHRQFPAGTAMAFQHKYYRADTMEELQRVLEPLPFGHFPMVQEYIPGRGIGVSMLMRNGKPVLTFSHRRIREFPPEGGLGVFCEAVSPDPKLREESAALLAEMGWEGVAMVEYRSDPETGRYALMEVNGRFWGSLPTAVQAGADFPFWLYRTSFPDAPMPSSEYRVGMRARSLAGDTKWLLSTLRNGNGHGIEPVAEYMAAFRPSTRYFIWAWDDPAPAINNLVGRFKGRHE
jgi:predicted ATP-grasp superfamily ATP-dependent carboligase